MLERNWQVSPLGRVSGLGCRQMSVRSSPFHQRAASKMLTARFHSRPTRDHFVELVILHQNLSSFNTARSLTHGG